MASSAHTHVHSFAGSRLRTAFFLTVIILLVEGVAGYLAHSVALLSDAAHVLTDLVALGLAWFAAVQAVRPPDARNTYGYHRTGILAAMINALLLVLIVFVIGFEAVRRLQQPEPVLPWLMAVSAFVGIAINLWISFGLRGESDNLNVRAAMLHIIGDVGVSVAVIVAAIVIGLTGWYPADPLLSLAIAALIAVGAFRILTETVDILMEASPRDLDMNALVADLKTEPEVADIHDLHVWSIAGGMRVLSAHVKVHDNLLLSNLTPLQHRLNERLAHRHHIGHSTLQFECEGCADPVLYCSMHAGDLHQHVAEDELAAANSGTKAGT